MEVIAITNQKGGTGKTTSVLGIGSALIQMGKKVLFIDLDPQSNLTRGLGMKHVFLTSADFMMGKDKCIFNSKVSNNSLIPANDALYAKESELMGFSALPQNLLKKALDKVKDRFDYVLIDCPPALGLYTINALIAADSFYIPMQAGFFSLEGLNKVLRVTEQVRELNPNLEFGGVFITKLHPNDRRIVAKDIINSIRETLGRKFLDIFIREDISADESQIKGKLLHDYAPQSRILEDYTMLTNKILKS
ncbi:MAG: ParA family protein [Cyclobacteriaceae bacterium]|nr:ParA family protein [Cyclobacteriaceae bacterium]